MIILSAVDIINPTGKADLSGIGLTGLERERYVHMHQGISVVGLVFDILDLLCLTVLLVGVRMERPSLLLPAMLLLPVDILWLIASIIAYSVTLGKKSSILASIFSVSANTDLMIFADRMFKQVVSSSNNSIQVERWRHLVQQTIV